MFGDICFECNKAIVGDGKDYCYLQVQMVAFSGVFASAKN